MTVFAAVGLTLLFGGASRLAGAVLTTGLAVAWARLFLGVHFPLDMVGAVVVAGAAYGVAAPMWRPGGEPLVALAERLYRAVLARPIAAGWVRP
jgi:undecaprenyl-diphosphatase